MNPFGSIFIIAIVFTVFSGEGRGGTISGMVMELQSGTPDVIVCLCEGHSGMPLSINTFKPIIWNTGPIENPAGEMAIRITDSQGLFSFENVPDGQYRLIAQKWIGPYKDIFEIHGTIIQLLGSADDVRIPSTEGKESVQIAISPPGQGIIQFDQKVGNNETFMFLSKAQPEFDPILGFYAPGKSFWKELIGFNRMPLGKSTVSGTPPESVYAFFVAADNKPGFTWIEVKPAPSGFVRVPAEPFVAGWSNGRKSPPENLRELMSFLEKNNLSADDLLELPELSRDTHSQYQKRINDLMDDLSRTVDLPEGRNTRIGDLLAVIKYRQLMQ